jgi:hypothetical protein
VRKINRVLGVLALAFMALLLGSTASAAPAPAPAPIESVAGSTAQVDADYCQIDAAVPTKFGANVISSYGRQTCFGDYHPQRILVLLERSRWFGWEEVARCRTEWTNDAITHCTTGSFICSGQYEYQTRVLGEARSGAVSRYVTSRVVTIGC